MKEEGGCGGGGMSFQSLLTAVSIGAEKDGMRRVAVSASEELMRQMAVRQEHDIFNAATPPVFPASTGLVLASPLTLLHMFMDPEQWSSVFSNIVSTATTLEVLFPWEKEKPNNGALQVMTAEFYLPSPLFRGGEVKFARMCRETGYKTWVVVDFSLETVFPGAGAISSHPTRRRPSGCLIQELHPGVSMVTWVDNMQCGT
ncbi:unnamed protein product [Cuscuta epithymum]|uniref:START domain-containing protein n=1 Tax=Cuscuta epithymum TaxID=186058 RepID=A0AAV0E676_9ASTE|nr:unnamed protein product [Cuscuta epithymum]CAH9135690.1 unnamed protein product [Cuscuta epithymum]